METKIWQLLRRITLLSHSGIDEQSMDSSINLSSESKRYEYRRHSGIVSLPHMQTGEEGIEALKVIEMESRSRALAGGHAL